MRLLPSLSSALNMSTAAALSELLLSAFRSSDESISPLPSASASSNTALREKISFLLYFLDILDNAPDILAATLVRRGTWVRAACVRARTPSLVISLETSFVASLQRLLGIDGCDWIHVRIVELAISITGLYSVNSCVYLQEI